MFIRVRCRRCGNGFRLRPEWVGRRRRCPNRDCGCEYVVPKLRPDQLERLTLHPEAVVLVGVETPSEPVPSPRPAVRHVRKRSARRRIGRSIAAACLAVVGLGLAAIWIPHDPFGGGGSSQVGAAEVKSQMSAPFSEHLPFFQKYCFDCHSGDEPAEGLSLDDTHTLEDLLKQRRRWEKVLRLIKIGSMPPPEMDQPTPEEREKTLAWLDHKLFYVDCSTGPDPGRVTVRRLNKTEYNNTVRDLVGVDFKPASDFPSDDVGYGFDNIGDVLTVPPLLIEKYLDAAEQVANKAILTRDPEYFYRTVKARDMEGSGSASNRDDGKAMASAGAAHLNIKFPRAGGYILRMTASADQAGREPAKMELSLNNRKIKVFEVRGKREEKTFEHRLTVPEGEVRLSLAFINDHYDAEKKEDRNLYLHRVEIEGPLGLPKELPESHTRLLTVRPGLRASSDQAAARNLKPLLARAFRRPVDDAEVAKYAKFVKLATDRGESFDRGMQIALQAILVSPQFLFRVEQDRRSTQPDGRHAINDYELASRLSYFLWSSMPDDELFDLAQKGQLRNDDVLERQVKRMLADQKADALIANFAGQWLGLRKLATNEVEPDRKIFPSFNDEVRSDLWKETELFFGHIVREDRSVLELLNGQYSFLNERLAKHYGIDGVQGEEFRKVTLGGKNRSGVVTNGSILLLTSYSDRTSPVKRGEWVLTNLLGDAPPPPPPTVPGLDETQKASPNMSLREQLLLHRADPGCASCHKVMDEIGFGLENFDAVGRWRDKDGKFPIDSAGTLPSGETFKGPVELVNILMARQDDFSRCLSEKLLTYALGRGLEYYDKCTLDDLVTQLRSKDYRFSVLVTAIVKSEPFRMRRAEKSNE